MRHRIGMAEQTCIGGNSSPCLLNNKGKINKVFADDAIKTYFEPWGGVDYEISHDEISVGIEPTYAGDNLLIISIHKNKDNSYIQRGHAFGYWGSGICSKKRLYKDYKRKGKFIRFVDKWHSKLFSVAPIISLK